MASPLHIATKSSSTTSTSDPLASAPASASTSQAQPASPPPEPTLPALHLAAQSGDLSALYALLPEGCDESVPNETDAQGITALHWAAINNNYQGCKLLLERGANVDAVGGDLSATALHWAARNGHVYIVHLLLSYSADPNLVDSQTFNTLHLAVHSSAALLVCYLLFTSQPIAVDAPDTEGHTALHWACYQGDALSVDLLLRAGASVLRADNAGLTALHWAAVKGNAACIKRVVEAGADLGAKEGAGKTAREMAGELKSLGAFKRGLVEAGLDGEGRRVEPTLSPDKTKKAIFVLPTITLGLIFVTLSVLPWWSALLLSGAEFFGMHHIVSKVLLNMKGPEHADRLTKSPYLCAIIIASLVWSSYVWWSRFVLNATEGYHGTVLFCGIGILLTSWNFFRAITLDPGHVPLPTGEGELKEQIEALVESTNFNGMNFCLPCLARRPLRSKHSHATKRCTARFDHYCPWIWNDVGFNNHRQFLLFVSCMVASILLFLRLTIAYFSASAPDLPADVTCVLPSVLCTASHFDTFTLAVSAWLALQLSWTVILLGAQLWQVCRQMTTLEVSNVGRYGYMGGKPGVSAAAQQGLSSAHVHGPECNHGPVGARKKGKLAFLAKILGIDRFTEGKAAEGLRKAGEVGNPFDLGVLANCRDFWTRGRELGVDYEALYEIPEGGFGRAVRERRRREKEEDKGGVAGGGGPRLMSRGAVGGASGGRKAGYERVAMEEV